MVGAARVVRADAPAELGEDEGQHLVLDAARREVGLEGGERARQVLELRILRRELAAVGVEAAPVDRDERACRARRRAAPRRSAAGTRGRSWPGSRRPLPCS